MKSTTIRGIAFQVLSVVMIATATADDKVPDPLPFVRDFKPERYLGKWYEVARLPTPIQPAGTLAVAEYAAGKEPGQVTVKNTAFDKGGKKLAEIAGQAKLADGDPPGRLLVSFGPVMPTTPNYHVIHVDEDYRYAVVGVPDRKSLWILAREVPIGEEPLKSLREIAQKAGFDVTKLVVAPWGQIPKAEQDAAGQPATGPESNAGENQKALPK
ncbi:MAG: lipocalin family protein [Verrucomicrobiales bacterium]